MSDAPPPASRLELLLAVVAATGLLVLETSYAPLNTDLGWILDFGHKVLDRGALPATNESSFVAPDHPVVMHEWLACVVTALLHGTFGAPGLAWMKWLLAAATLALMAATLRRLAVPAIPSLVALVWASNTLGLAVQLVRPQLFTLVGLAYTVLAALAGGRALLWGLVPAYALWANLHGGWFAGWPVLAALLFLRAFRPGDAPRLGRLELAAIAVLAALATLVNPYGPTLHVHTLHHVSDGVRLLNREWQPLFALRTLGGAEWMGIRYVGLVTLVWIFGRRALGLPMLALWLLAIASSLSAVRNLRWLSILLTPGTALALAALWQRLPSGLLERVTLRSRWVFGLAATLPWIPFALDPAGATRLGDYAAENSGGIIWYARRHALEGTVWNDFDHGGTLLWAAPRLRLAVDGRNVAAYPEEVLRETMTWDESPEPLVALRRYQPRFVLLREASPAYAIVRPALHELLCDQGLCLLTADTSLFLSLANGPAHPPRQVFASEYFQGPRPEDADAEKAE